MYKVKHNLIIFILVFNINYSYANINSEITGQVKDKNSNKNLAFCNFSVININDSIIIRGLTNEKGFFFFDIKKGKYSLVLDYSGYLTDTFNIQIGFDNKYIGIFELEPNEELIDEVIVSGKTFQIEIDREVHLVTESLRIASSNSFDVLDKINGINLDIYKNLIEVDGSNKVIILVDGLEKNKDYIKNISPERLKEIVIIRNPGGRYALENYYAVINIKLKNNYRGSEIYIEDLSLFDVDAKEEALLPLNNLSIGFSKTTGKINLYADLRNSYANNNLLSYTKKEFKDGLIVEKNNEGSDNNLLSSSFFNNFTFGIDYYLNPKHTISFENNSEIFPFENDITNKSSEVACFENDEKSDYYTDVSKNISNVKEITNSFFYIGKVNNRNTINADFSISNYKDLFSNSYNSSKGYNRYEKGINNKNYTSLYVELEHLFRNKSVFTFGFANNWKSLNNSFIYETNKLVSDNSHFIDTLDFKYANNRNKVYAYYSLNASSVISLKIGGAIENSLVNVYDSKKTYILYQPFVNIDYKGIKKINIKLKYTTNSIYPSILQTNPFVKVIDSQITEKGNPLLTPQTIHDISVRFSIMHGIFTFEPYYNFSNNYISRVVVENDNNVEYVYGNFEDYSHKGIRGNLSIPLFNRSFIIRSNFDFFRSNISFNKTINAFNDWALTQQFMYINKKHKTIYMFRFRKKIIKTINVYGYDLNDNDMWMFFVKQSLLKRRLSVMLGYVLPINWGVSYEQGSYFNDGTYIERNIHDISALKNIIFFRISLRLNKGMDIKGVDKDIKQEVEKKGNGIF